VIEIARRTGVLDTIGEDHPSHTIDEAIQSPGPAG
jgi:hypothetical protein